MPAALLSRNPRPGGRRARSPIITLMRQAALRTLLVVSERPHPWAFLRDRLDPDLVTVEWSRPAAAGRASAPWMVAGAGDDPGRLAAFAERLICWRWVGPAPAGQLLDKTVIPVKTPPEFKHNVPGEYTFLVERYSEGRPVEVLARHLVLVRSAA